ncbi:MAG: 50S ribosomal protein L30e [Candidatus Hadarchaeota archaeon]
MDVSKEIGQAISTGEVAVGIKKSTKALKRGSAKLVIFGSNCPENALADIRHYAKIAGVPVHAFSGDSGELGLACGKPFTVNAIAIIDPGSSSILSAVERR